MPLHKNPRSDLQAGLQSNSIAADAIDAALTWLIARSTDKQTLQQQANFESWLADPAHLCAWQSVSAYQAAVQTIHPTAGNAALRQAGAGSATPSTTRRNLLCAMAVAAAGALLVSEKDTFFYLAADQRTATGQQRTVILQDGTRVLMDTQTAFDIHFDGISRKIRLRSGSLLIETSHDAKWTDQPFLVETSRGTVRALGTRFTVAESSHRIKVAVLQGAVNIQPASQSSPPLRLEAGTQSSFDARAVAAAEAIDHAAQGWTQGLIVAHNQPLGAFLAEVSRYRNGVLRCEATAANLPVTGVFPVDDTDRILVSLAGELPVTIRTRSRYWVSVEKKP